MVDTVWVSTFSQDYLVPGNWNNLAPTGSNNGVFGSGSTIKTITLAAGGVTAGGWIFNAGAYTIDVSGSPVDLQGAGIQISGTGRALIEVQSLGDLVFQNSSSAGSATIEAQSGGTITFDGNSSGGTARLIADSGGVLDFSAGAGPGGSGNVAGSIEGGGTFDLGGHPLTVGGNNRSTTVSGTINGSFGCSLAKVGTGTLTLVGTDNFPGQLILQGGTVDLASAASVAFLSSIKFVAGAQTLRIESAALPANEFAPLISSFGQGDAIDLPSLSFVPGATAHYTAFLTVSVTSGSTTITLDSVSVAGAGTTFAVLGDHTGGSRVMLATIESRPHKLVDARHHPTGQLSPTNGPDVIVALGANDTIKGLGGNDSLVGGAAGDVLYGGPGADNFIFQKVKASPPGHPDTIWDFSHAQHDKIDLYDLFHAANHHPLVFIGAQTFAQYHHLHPHVFGMVRYAGGVVQANVNHNLAPDFAVTMHNAPALHVTDFVL